MLRLAATLGLNEHQLSSLGLPDIPAVDAVRPKGTGRLIVWLPVELLELLKPAFNLLNDISSFEGDTPRFFGIANHHIAAPGFTALFKDNLLDLQAVYEGRVPAWLRARFDWIALSALTDHHADEVVAAGSL